MPTREDVLKERSRERLQSIATKKIRTTMIGALDSVEKKLGHLWGHDELDPTAEQIAFRKVYDELRSEILDKGNNQIRNLEAELIQYEVEWKRHQAVLIPIERMEGL